MDEILSKLRKKEENIPDTLSDSYLEEPTSSQCQTPFTTMKLDFDRLKLIKNENSYSIQDILKYEDYKFKDQLVGIVKKIERYSTDIICLELVDESGSICCSCVSSLIKEYEIRIGSIICLQDFGLWKIDGNHINLVKRNIIKVH